MKEADLRLELLLVPMTTDIKTRERQNTLGRYYENDGSRWFKQKARYEQSINLPANNRFSHLIRLHR
uniref:Uncharacterized protein n=1 Tax=Candidatus Methanogaster sp. ANME-2c ERB4 TaxID=2759911 RepID=A0A7G9Y841_9EURY|nr:hypothetical protein NLDJDEJO_00007 [Methanosarcinales archaeon ANME-2c ERB4]QNO46568.1 hypothetical protein NKHCAGDB_00001 [Methanosarcinales archaeon ANME-2c ERB4]